MGQDDTLYPSFDTDQRIILISDFVLQGCVIYFQFVAHLTNRDKICKCKQILNKSYTETKIREKIDQRKNQVQMHQIKGVRSVFQESNGFKS